MRDFKKDLRFCKKATKGPWRHMLKGTPHAVLCDSDSNVVCVAYTNADFSFIKQARSGWSVALKEVIRLREENKQLRKENERLRGESFNG